jgi:hypothetical protein
LVCGFQLQLSCLGSQLLLLFRVCCFSSIVFVQRFGHFRPITLSAGSWSKRAEPDVKLSAVLTNRGCGFLGRIAYASSLFGFMKYGVICHSRVFHKKNSIQLECVSKAYIKDLMYLKRNTKFLPDRWGLKTPPASQSSLNENRFPFT